MATARCAAVSSFSAALVGAAPVHTGRRVEVADYLGVCQPHGTTRAFGSASSSALRIYLYSASHAHS